MFTEICKSKFGKTLRRFWSLRPRLVFPRQEVEVQLKFDMGKMDINDLYKAREYLSKCGISFDSGGGCGGYDWEWDYSLSGPVKVIFKRVRN